MNRFLTDYNPDQLESKYAVDEETLEDGGGKTWCIHSFTERKEEGEFRNGHRIDAYYEGISLLSSFFDDIMLSIKGFERISVTEQEVIDAGQVCKSQSKVY